VYTPAPPRPKSEPEGPDPATVRRAADRVANTCQDAYLSKDARRIEQIARGGSLTEQQNLRNLLGVLRDGFRVQIEAFRDAEHSLGTRSGTVVFTSRVTWRDSFGGNRSAPLTVRAAVRGEGTTWTLESCRIDAGPRM
jgi:hypothetical protein